MTNTGQRLRPGLPQRHSQALATIAWRVRAGCVRGVSGLNGRAGPPAVRDLAWACQQGSAETRVRSCHGPRRTASDRKRECSSEERPRAVDSPFGRRYDLRLLCRTDFAVRFEDLASVAQLVELRFCKPAVVGSSPVASSKRLIQRRREPGFGTKGGATGEGLFRHVLAKFGASELFHGGMPERLMGTGCKPVGFAYVGSNPTSPTIF